MFFQKPFPAPENTTGPSVFDFYLTTTYPRQSEVNEQGVATILEQYPVGKVFVGAFPTETAPILAVTFDSTQPDLCSKVVQAGRGSFLDIVEFKNFRDQVLTTWVTLFVLGLLLMVLFGFSVKMSVAHRALCCVIPEKEE